MWMALTSWSHESTKTDTLGSVLFEAFLALQASTECYSHPGLRKLSSIISNCRISQTLCFPSLKLPQKARSIMPARGQCSNRLNIKLSTIDKPFRLDSTFGIRSRPNMAGNPSLAFTRSFLIVRTSCASFMQRRWENGLKEMI